MFSSVFYMSRVGNAQAVDGFDLPVPVGKGFGGAPPVDWDALRLSISSRAAASSSLLRGAAIARQFVVRGTRSCAAELSRCRWVRRVRLCAELVRRAVEFGGLDTLGASWPCGCSVGERSRSASSEATGDLHGQLRSLVRFRSVDHSQMVIPSQSRRHQLIADG